MMKDYKSYSLEDFLLDEEFREWVASQDGKNAGLWNDIAVNYPEKDAIIQQAQEIILTFLRTNAGLSAPELELEVSRILATTTVEADKPHPFRFHIKWFSVAAAALLLTGIGWVVTRNNKQPLSAEFYRQYISWNLAPLRDVANQTSLQLDIQLPDGSKVKLTPGSRISYAEGFVKNKKREVYLSGEAFFDVQKDAKNPFFVYANGLVTRVVGTSFLISARDAGVKVLVKTGRVTVVPMKDLDNQDKKNTEVLLTPNQQALFSSVDNLISRSVVDAPEEIVKGEEEPDFNFENRPMREVFSVMEKVYGIPIIYDETTMRNCFLRVALSNEPFFSKMDIICKTIGAEYQVKDGQILITGEGCE